MAEVTCANGHTNEIGDQPSRFCRDCGAALVGRCPNGHALEPGAAFCATCGTAAERADDTALIGPSGTGNTTPAGTPTVAPDVRPPPPGQGTTSYPQVVAPPPDGRPLPPGQGTTAYPPVVPPPPALAYGAPPPPAGGPVVVQPRKGRINPLVWVGIGLAVVLGGIAVAIALTSSKSSTAAPSSHTQVTTGRTTPTTPPSGLATAPPTTEPISQQQATALSGLLTQSANDRAAIVAAVSDISDCGDLAGDEATLNGAYTSRESLLSQLQGLHLGLLPGGSQLNTYLTNAWQASAASDQSYAAWASDELNSGCTVGDDSDPNFQNAQVSDGQSTANKTSFAAAWDPVASSYDLATVTASSF